MGEEHQIDGLWNRDRNKFGDKDYRHAARNLLVYYRAMNDLVTDLAEKEISKERFVVAVTNHTAALNEYVTIFERMVKHDRSKTLPNTLDNAGSGSAGIGKSPAD